MEEIKAGRSIRQTSKKYNIPKTTLQNKKCGLLKPTIGKNGPSCILGDSDESKLVEWVIYVSDRGFPVTKLQLINSVQMLLKASKKKTMFKNQRLGRRWYEAFLVRHPEICDKFSQNLLYTRASVTEKCIRGWFSFIIIISARR